MVQYRFLPVYAGRAYSASPDLLAIDLRRDYDRSRFGLVRNRSDFDASGSVNRKRVYGSVRDQSEPSLRAGSLCGSIWRNVFVCQGLGRKITVINM